MARIHVIDGQSPEPFGSMARAMNQAMLELGITVEKCNEIGLTREENAKVCQRTRELLGQE